MGRAEVSPFTLGHLWAKKRNLKMKYFYNAKRKGTAAHIWTGDDTACKMFSTGGIRRGKKELHDELDHRRVCLMCQNNAKKYFTTSLTPS
jgi:hypothetical protein